MKCFIQELATEKSVVYIKYIDTFVMKSNLTHLCLRISYVKHDAQKRKLTYQREIGKRLQREQRFSLQCL